ncbi:GTF2H1 [Bugula neritina]|uniref:GTF2H1 n=1 Tax=Bugula neritina TaxID=10212 RepID=A0A7J7JRV1_BUGNE|nr:GTF2H1 [Bugula neritina]
MGSKDVFTECAKVDDKEMINDLLATAFSGNAVDMTSMADNPIGEDFGESTETAGKQSSSQSSNQTIIKRFNHHSTRVLKTADAAASSSSVEAADKPSDSKPTLSKRKLAEASSLVDLDSDETVDKKSDLTLRKVSRYFHGPVPQSSQNKYRSTEAMIRSANALVHEVEQWTGEIKHNLPVL